MKYLYYIALLILFLFPFSFSATSNPFVLNLTTNTVYQNTNASADLNIYITTHSSSLKGYLGQIGNMQKIIDLTGGTITITSVVYTLAGYNMTAYMLVEPNQYYKFNYTNATFLGEYLNTTSSTSTPSSSSLSLIYAITALGFVMLFVFGYLGSSYISLLIGKYGFLLFTLLAVIQGSIDYYTTTPNTVGEFIYLISSLFIVFLVIDTAFFITFIIPKRKRGKSWKVIMFGEVDG